MQDLKKDRKRFVRMVGWGALFVFPAVFALSFAFTSLKMPDGLSIFLVVLLSSILIYVYYLLFVYFENKRKSKYNKKNDPFNY